MMLEELDKWGYKVYHKVLNTKTQGLPQSRPRFYLVALLHLKGTRFKFPREVEPVPLRKLLERPKAKPIMNKPLGPKAEKIVQRAVEKLKAGGFKGADEAIVDIGCSAAWSSVMPGCSPCLTASRCKSLGGHYLLRRERMMTEKEVCRLQGIPDSRINYVRANVRKSVFLHAVGNAMSSNVLARVLARAGPSRLCSAHCCVCFIRCFWPGEEGHRWTLSARYSFRPALPRCPAQRGLGGEENHRA